MVDVSPRVDQSKLGIYGLNVSRASDSTLEISAGRCKDSDNKIDIGVGEDFAQWTGGSVSAPLTIDVSVVGANGIDAGSLDSDKVYSVYVIADSSAENSVAGLCSLASNDVPTLPFGYDAYRLVGYALTDGSSDFLLMNQSGLGHARSLHLDEPISVASGSSNSSYSDVDCSAAVAPVDNVLVYMQVDQEANAADDVVNLQKYGGTGDTYSQRAAYATGTGTWTGHAHVPVGLNSGAPSINAKVSAGDYSLYVLGFHFEV